MLKSCVLSAGEMHYHDSGSGDVILFVHGFPLDYSMWRFQLGFFQATHRVIAPDLRGFGRNAPVSGCVTMADFADDLAELLDRIGVTNRITFCGLSMGGYIAWQFVERHADRLGKLIVCDTRSLADASDAASTRLKSAEKLEAEGNAFLVDMMLPKLFAPANTKFKSELTDVTKRVMLATDPRTCAAAQRGMAARPDFGVRLGTIAVPTLVMCGELDIISPPKEMRAIAAAIPGARYREFPGIGHMAPLEAPSEVNETIAEFLDVKS